MNSENGNCGSFMNLRNGNSELLFIMNYLYNGSVWNSNLHITVSVPFSSKEKLELNDAGLKISVLS